MALGVIARKAGMTQVFAEDGTAVPVTVLEVEPCKVVLVRRRETDGYDAAQVGYGRAPRRLPRPLAGHFAKHGCEPMRGLREFRLDAGEEVQPGQELTAALFSEGQRVDVAGRTKGRGFAGVMRRWNFGGGRASHGAEKVHRQMGSTGQCQDPGRVFPGKKMPGHYGDERVTVQNLVVVRVDAEKNRILVKGAVPGPRGGLVEVRPAVKGATR